MISMITFILGSSVIGLFSILFYLEDRDGGGLYDPDPRPKNKKYYEMYRDTGHLGENKND